MSNTSDRQFPDSTVADALWAPLSYTAQGVEEIHPEWVLENIDRVTVVDVREPAEFTGPLGHILHAILIPLDQLQRSFSAIPDDKPLVTVCHVGGRSAQAWAILKHLGVARVANMTGGMLHWHALGLPVEHQSFKAT